MEKIPVVDESVEEIPAWKAELQKIIENSPAKIQEELDRSPDVTWVSALASQLTVLSGKLEISVIRGKLTEQEAESIQDRIKILSSKMMTLKNEYAGNHDEIPESDKLVLMSDFENLLED